MTNFNAENKSSRGDNNGQRRSRPFRVAYCGVLTALALIFSYVEALIPISVGVPGVKLGLANLVVLFGLTFLHPGEVLAISLARILLSGFLFGNGMSILYSLCGGLLSFLVMFLLIKIKGFSMTGVSIAGGVSHNIGQILCAAAVVRTVKILWYLPVLIIAGTAAGFLMGILFSIVRRALPDIFNNNK